MTRFYLLVSCDNVFTESVDPHIEDVLLLSEIQYVTRYLHSNDIHILNSWVQPATCTKHNNTNGLLWNLPAKYKQTLVLFTNGGLSGRF